MLSVITAGSSDVVTAKGRRRGRVVEVLFHPDEPRVVGLLVRRPRLLWLLDRPDLHLALDRVDPVDGDFVLRAGREAAGAWDAAAARRLNLDWERSVIWRGMPVRTTSGTQLGRVRDAAFDPATGRLSALGLTGGMATDAVVGVRDFSAKLVQGFDGAAVVVSDEALGVETDGGAAAAAGKASAVVAHKAGGVAEQAVKVAATATVYGAQAVKAAARSKAGRKAKGWLKSIKDDVVNAMGDPDDE